MSDRELVAAFEAIARGVAEVDLAAPDAAALLEAAHPFTEMGPLAERLRAARDAGWLTPRRATPTLCFGRLAKPTEATGGNSLDVVDMAGAGAAHGHPRGEASLCFPEEGAPRFEGCAQGWIVLPPGSHHTPRVEGGRMTIVYFLPGGSVEWGSSSSSAPQA